MWTNGIYILIRKNQIEYLGKSVYKKCVFIRKNQIEYLGKSVYKNSST